MDLLKKLLEGTDIEYTEVKFRSDQGFSSARAFVSYSYDEPIVAGKTIVAIISYRLLLFLLQCPK